MATAGRNIYDGENNFDSNQISAISCSALTLTSTALLLLICRCRFGFLPLLLLVSIDSCPTCCTLDIGLAFVEDFGPFGTFECIDAEL